MFTLEYVKYINNNMDLIRRKHVWSRYIHGVTNQRIKSFVQPNAKVLAIGPWAQDLLMELSPVLAVGVDPHCELEESKPPSNITLHKSFGELQDCHETFDYILLPFSLGFMEDIMVSLMDLQRFCHEHTRVIIIYYSKAWQPLIRLAEMLGLKVKETEMNWVPPKEIENLMELSDYQIVKDFMFCLMPARMPLISNLINKYLGNLPLLRRLGLFSIIVGRSRIASSPERKALQEPMVSIIIPARNEEGHIADIVRRTPDFPGGSEIIFVEGNSKDDTRGAIERVIAENPQRRIFFLTQDGKGKKNAVLKGFAAATGEIFLILDADMTVPPEAVPRFVNTLVSGKAEFINGSRLVYPMRGKAMRFVNLLGNIFFSKAFSYLLDQPVRDTLCGTKVIWRSDYQKMLDIFKYFGNLDPFGDFDLLFGATCLNLKIIDLPIRYEERVYGETNINRWRDGAILMKIVLLGISKLKFNWLPLFSHSPVRLPLIQRSAGN